MKKNNVSMAFALILVILFSGIVFAQGAQVPPNQQNTFNVLNTVLQQSQQPAPSQPAQPGGAQPPGAGGSGAAGTITGAGSGAAGTITGAGSAAAGTALGGAAAVSSGTALLPEPQNVKAVWLNSGQQVMVSWDAVSGADKYEVFFKTDSSAAAVSASSGQIIHLNFLHLNGGKDYWYSVTAFDSSTGRGSSSAYVMVGAGSTSTSPTTPTLPPETPFKDLWIGKLLDEEAKEYSCNMFNPDDPLNGKAYGVCFPGTAKTGKIKFPIENASVDSGASNVFVGIYKGFSGRELPLDAKQNEAYITKKLQNGESIEWSRVGANGFDFFFEKGQESFEFSVEGWDEETPFRVYVCQNKEAGGNLCDYFINEKSELEYRVTYVEPNLEAASLTVTKDRGTALDEGALDTGPVLPEPIGPTPTAPVLTPCTECNSIQSCLACLDEGFVRNLFQKRLELVSGYKNLSTGEIVRVKEPEELDALSANAPVQLSAALSSSGVLLEWEGGTGKRFEVLVHSDSSEGPGTPNEVNVLSLPSTFRLYRVPEGQTSFSQAGEKSNYEYSIRAIGEDGTESVFFGHWVKAGEKWRKIGDASDESVKGIELPSPGAEPIIPPSGEALDEREYVVLSFLLADGDTAQIPGTEFDLKVDIKSEWTRLWDDWVNVEVLSRGTGTIVCGVNHLHRVRGDFGRMNEKFIECPDKFGMILEYVSFEDNETKVRLNAMYNKEKAVHSEQIAAASTVRGYEFPAKIGAYVFPGTNYKVHVIDSLHNSIDVEFLENDVSFCGAKGINDNSILLGQRTNVKKKTNCRTLGTVYYIYLGSTTFWVFFDSKGFFSSTINVVSVNLLYEGNVGIARVEIREGTAGEKKVSFGIKDALIGLMLRRSAETAAEVAENVTGESLTGKEVVYSMDEWDAFIAEGGSAGAALTIAAIGAIRGENPRRDVAVTGAIEQNGEIRAVDGIPEKLEAWALEGGKVFLVPASQKTPELVEKGRIFGMEVKGVSTIEEAVEEFF